MESEPTGLSVFDKAKAYCQREDLVVEDGEYTDLTISNAYSEGFNEGQKNPIVKRLKWEYIADSTVAKTPIGWYFAFDNYWYFESIQNYCNVNSINEAKQAAQSDFEERVRKCLEL